MRLPRTLALGLVLASPGARADVPAIHGEDPDLENVRGEPGYRALVKARM